MGVMNLLKGNWEGKVGETVGAKWKNRKTIRTYTKPANPNTAAQQEVRNGFKQITSFTALFADSIKYKSALDTSGMSVRNAILKINKDMVKDETVAFENLLISKGGLQKVQAFAASLSGGKVAVTWTKPTATNFSADAKLIVVAVDAVNQVAEAFEAAYDAESASGDVTFAGTEDVIVYGYYLDKRGSSKVASVSSGVKIAGA